MRHAQHRSGLIRQHHRQAIGRHDHQGPVPLAGDGGIGTRRRGCRRIRPGGRGVRIEYRRAMHLVEPQGLGGQGAPQPLAVFLHGARVVAYVRAQIQAVPRRPTDATDTPGRKIAHPGPRFSRHTAQPRRGFNHGRRHGFPR
jgi:hypothetical protein